MTNIFNPCDPPKRTGITIFPPDIAPCDCYDDIFVPAGSIASLLKRGLKSAAETWFVSVLRTARIAKLTAKVSAAQAKLDRIRNIVRTYIRNLTELVESQKLYRISVRVLTESVTRIKNELDTISGKVDDLLRQIDEIINAGFIGLEEIAERDRLIAQLQRDLLPLKEQKRQIAAKLASAEKTLEFEQKLLQETTEQLTQTRGIKSWPPDFIVPQGNLSQQTAALESIQNTQQQNMKTLTDDLFDLNKDSSSGSWIDSKYADIGGEMLTLIIDLLSAFSFVEKHTCRDPSMLDESTCLCTLCPDNQQLCEPYQLDIGIQPPMSRVGDELNSCVDDCCGIKVLKTNFSSISSTAGYFFHPCECYCPDGTTEKPCYDPSQDCDFFPGTNKPSEQIACADPPPDGLPESSLLGSVTKYQWNPNKCDWECKPIPCPEGQTQDPSSCDCVPEPSYVVPQNIKLVP